MYQNKKIVAHNEKSAYLNVAPEIPVTIPGTTNELQQMQQCYN